MKPCLLCIATVVALSAPADAQRLIDARTAFARPDYPRSAYAQERPDSTGKHRMELSVVRVIIGGGAGVAVGAPIAYIAFAGESAEVLVVAGVAYFVGTAAGAAFISSECSFNRSFVRALGGAFLGGLVGGGIAGAINGRTDLAAVATAAFGLLGAPVGAAWALWKCD
jgi:hypothetical protein